MPVTANLLSMHYYIYYPKQPYEVDVIITFILQIRKRQFSEIKGEHNIQNLGM